MNLFLIFISADASANQVKKTRQAEKRLSEKKTALRSTFAQHPLPSLISCQEYIICRATQYMRDSAHVLHATTKIDQMPTNDVEDMDNELEDIDEYDDGSMIKMTLKTRHFADSDDSN
jgi:hypothetical protein